MRHGGGDAGLPGAQGGGHPAHADGQGVVGPEVCPGEALGGMC